MINMKINTAVYVRMMVSLKH